MNETWIVVTGGPPAWADCGSAALRMADAFWALGYRMLYIEGGAAPRPFRRVLGQRRDRRHHVVADLERKGFFVMRTSNLPAFSVAVPEFVRRWASTRTTGRAAKFLAASDAGRVLVFHYNWLLPDLFRHARESVRHVYECLEDHPSAPRIVAHPRLRRHVNRLEKKMLSRADLVVSASAELAELRPSPRSAVVPVAVDAKHFARPVREDPHARLGIQGWTGERPRVGFAGSVSARSDWAMVRSAAAQTPEWQWIAAGALDGVRAYGPKNLHWVGPVRYSALPSWLQHWDIGIVPYAPETDFNRRTWPMKLLEYLAAGLPIVSTDIPAARQLARRLPGLVFIARDPTPAEFVAAARRALALPAWKREAARAFARQFSWEARANQVLTLLGGPTG